MKILQCLFLSSSIFCITIAQVTPEQLLKSLTLDQKIGQLFTATTVSDEELAAKTIEWRKDIYRLDKTYIEELIEKYHIGGIIYFGNTSPEKQIIRTQHFQNLSSIPLLVMQDLEPEYIGFFFPGLFEFPNCEKLGTIENNDLIHELGGTIGIISKSLGVHIALTPVVDVNNNPKNPIIGVRSFGDNKENVAQKSVALINGMQAEGVFACAKHFPGHGDTTVDSHLDLPLIEHDQQRLRDIELYPFVQAIKAGVATIMTAHLEIPAFEKEKNRPSSLSKSIVTDLLQKELQFKGLVITDALEMQGVRKHFAAGESALEALKAGNDILLCSTNIPVSIDAIKKALTDGVLTEEEIDTHVLKILCAKAELSKHHDRAPSLEKFAQLDHKKIALLKEKLNKAMEPKKKVS